MPVKILAGCCDCGPPPPPPHICKACDAPETILGNGPFLWQIDLPFHFVSSWSAAGVTCTTDGGATSSAWLSDTVPEGGASTFWRRAAICCPSGVLVDARLYEIRFASEANADSMTSGTITSDVIVTVDECDPLDWYTGTSTTRVWQFTEP